MSKVVSFRLQDEEFDKMIIECERKDMSKQEWFERKIHVAKIKSNNYKLSQKNSKEVKFHTKSFIGGLLLMLIINLIILIFI